MGRKTKLVSAVGLVAGVLYLTKNKETVKKGIDKGIDIVVSQAGKWTSDPYVKKLGRPENLRDSNMVDEGAMTSVQYYNDLREDSRQENM
ncbi:MAG TPA: hypothetical protein H9994_00095 [Candidatus Salinicoccus merdavium]|nr:hypothetical protein [Candidatus Salinicoccus merdavium]